MLMEPIFYSGTGVYDFQYLEFLDRKYKYDKKWLTKEKNYEISDVKKIVNKIKDILLFKAEKVHLHDLKETLPKKIMELKKKNPKEDWEKNARELLPLMEFYQYFELFEYSGDYKAGWNTFYKNLVE